ncbi:SecY-interacting protein [Aliidiomarina quisquiliarum]|uniref:SecY-interacting protein n=1 Tax=Aliidiomarina quisquiliarum TaxID=2938947 RepID=UPI00208EECAB|nr:SecY-interacting protein [Aliidiomarina quisquiliarum]MCO4320433.1 SecY-interacting protein [Aliidiomarina quisquiliarum]
MSEVKAVLAQLHKDYATHYEKQGRKPTTDYVEEWQASCYYGEPNGEHIAWQAVAQKPATAFANVEKALELTLHGSIKDFFSQFWAGDLHVRFRDHNFTLLQVQLPEDAERLQQNLIGHVMMKQRLRQPITLFIGVGNEDDLIVSVNNETGAVGLEYVGKEQHELLASDLIYFLERLEPA